MGPKPRSTTLTAAEEAIVVEFRRRTLLPLNDMLGCLMGSIPALTGNALHRCLMRHGRPAWHRVATCFCRSRTRARA
jgi:hypothetical protein